MVQDHTVDADFCGHGLIGKEAISCAVLLRNFHLAIDGKVLGCILGNTAILTFLTQAIALVAFLIRNAAGACSLLRFAGCADEAFPILFFLQGDFNPLMEGAIVDLRGGLIVIGFHEKVLRFSISRNGGLWVLPKNGCKKPTAVLTEFSVSVCSKPAQKAATLFTCAAGYR